VQLIVVVGPLVLTSSPCIQVSIGIVVGLENRHPSTDAKRTHYLWRAVDQDVDVLDILVQSKRDKKAAKKFFRKLLKGLRDQDSRWKRQLGSRQMLVKK